MYLSWSWLLIGAIGRGPNVVAAGGVVIAAFAFLARAYAFRFVTAADLCGLIAVAVAFGFIA